MAANLQIRSTAFLRHVPLAGADAFQETLFLIRQRFFAGAGNLLQQLIHSFLVSLALLDLLLKFSRPASLSPTREPAYFFRFFWSFFILLKTGVTGREIVTKRAIIQLQLVQGKRSRIHHE